MIDRPTDSAFAKLSNFASCFLSLLYQSENSPSEPIARLLRLQTFHSLHSGIRQIKTDMVVVMLKKANANKSWAAVVKKIEKVE